MPKRPTDLPAQVSIDFLIYSMSRTTVNCGRKIDSISRTGCNVFHLSVCDVIATAAAIAVASALIWWPILICEANDLATPYDYGCNATVSSWTLKASKATYKFNIFHGNCTVKVDDPESESGNSSAIVLLRLFNLRRDSEKDGVCETEHSELLITIKEKPIDVCNASDEQLFFIFATMPFNLSLRGKGETRKLTPLSADVKIVSKPQNICALKTPYKVINVFRNYTYLYSSNNHFPHVAPNNSTCDRDGYSLNITAPNVTGLLLVQILAIPAKNSCWKLLLDERTPNRSSWERYRSGRNVSLSFKPHGCNSSYNAKTDSFCLLLANSKDTSDANDTTLASNVPTPRELNATLIAGCGAGVSLLLMAALAIGIMVYRRRRALQPTPSAPVIATQSSSLSKSQLPEAVLMQENDFYVAAAKC